jgi:glucosamine kinase
VTTASSALPVVVGVDGGGSRTRIRAEFESGEEAGAAVIGPASGTGRDPAELGRWLAEAVAGAAGPHRVAAVHCGLAGAGDASVRAAVQATLAERLGGAPVQVETDLQIALFDAFGRAPGVLLLAGTGSACLVGGRSGETRLVGGWGPAVGDEGSGFALGRAAVSAVLHAADGRGPATELTGRLTSETGTVDPWQLARWAASASRRELAALAPAVLEACAGGDGVASRLLEEAAQALVDHVRAAGETPRGVAVALSGGLLSRANPLEARVRALLSREGVRCLERPAVGLGGAVALARTAAGWEAPRR